jgi:hypothetical protein
VLQLLPTPYLKSPFTAILTRLIMSEDDHVTAKGQPASASRPPLSHQDALDSQSGSVFFSGAIKRKNTDEPEPIYNHRKRPRESVSRPRHLDTSNTSTRSLPETIPEALDESAITSRTPVEQNFAADPTTPTPHAPSGTVTTPQARGKDQSPAEEPLATPSNLSKKPSLSSAYTPMKLSSSNADPGCIPPSQSSSLANRHLNAKYAPELTRSSKQSIDSNKVAQLDADNMEAILKHELFGAVFQHDKFYEEFLQPDSHVQKLVREQTKLDSDGHLKIKHGLWSLSDAIAEQRDEKKVYGPLADALNAIGRVAFTAFRARNPNDAFRKSYRPFLDHHKSEALFDSPSDAATSPDLVKAAAEKNRAHWGDMELVIECKSDSKARYRNQAYMQLARYARAVFAHQIYRLRVFGFSLCGSIVNFVCFDRSGLLHSPDINLSTADGANSFVQHLITLLTLPAEKFGYDIRYSFHQLHNKEIVQTLFRFPGRSGEQAVNDVLCHRKCCCGRATCVSVLGDDVHKSIWRPEDRPDEGVTLSQFKGVFGVCQVLAYDHSTYSTKLEHPDALKVSPSASFFFPGSRHKSVAGSLASTQSKSASAQPPSAPPQPSALGPVPASPVSRCVRVKSDILMLRGTSLFEAQNPLHLLTAIHDALMGKCDSRSHPPITHL